MNRLFDFISYKIHLFLQGCLIAYFFLTERVSELMHDGPKAWAADFFLNNGYGRKSLILYKDILKKDVMNVPITNQIGCVNFIMTDYTEALRWFTETEFKKKILLKKNSSVNYNQDILILDRSWTLAIGHLAHINVLLKARRLGWVENKKLILSIPEQSFNVGESLLSRMDEEVAVFRECQIQYPLTNELIFGKDYKSLPHYQRNQIREGLSLSFWSGLVPGQKNLEKKWFAPYAAAVVRAAEHEGIESCVRQFSEDEKSLYRDQASVNFGLPVDAWYVILHVREPGYHKNWSKAHPSARNADIASYDNVIDYIIAKGGYVVRIGDDTMTPIRPRVGLVDFTNVMFKNEYMDIFLISDCSYYIGTNSGPSLIPDLFNKRCVLTNWTPLAVPNWFCKDKFIPKLVYDPSKKRNLTFQEMFDEGVATSQFMRDYNKKGLKLIDNTPEDILDLVIEMHSELIDNNDVSSPEDKDRRERFKSIILSNGGYIGSQIGSKFLEKNNELL